MSVLRYIFLQNVNSAKKKKLLMKCLIKFNTCKKIVHTQMMQCKKPQATKNKQMDSIRLEERG